MHSFVRSLVLGLSLLAFVGCSGDEKPTAEEVEPALKAYLIAQKGKTCIGTVTLNRMSIQRIGDFDKQFGGWPVYATFSVTCKEGSNSTTWNSDDPSSKAMASLARKTASGDIECSMPAMFQNAEEQLKQQLEEAFKKK
jgi:hypothetical protein